MNAIAWSLQNFPLQCNRAEMMWVACCLATEEGVAVCCSVRDALSVEAGAAQVDAVMERTQQTMQYASEVVLSGFGLRTDAKVVMYPNCYTDPGGKVTVAGHGATYTRDSRSSRTTLTD
jgi:DNA polymerase-1